MVMKPGQFQRSQRSCQDLPWINVRRRAQYFFCVHIHCMNYLWNSFCSLWYGCTPPIWRKTPSKRSISAHCFCFCFFIFACYLSRREAVTHDSAVCTVKANKDVPQKVFVGFIICITLWYLCLIRSKINL